MYSQAGYVNSVVVQTNVGVPIPTPQHTISQAPLSIYTILTPFFMLNADTAVQQIAQYVQHNAEIGMNATILYERGPYLSHLQGDTALHKLMRSGDLQVRFGAFRSHNSS